jgi:hypothetical protein
LSIGTPYFPFREALDMKQPAAVPFLLLLLLLRVPAAHASAGVNLRWTVCFGDGGASNRTIACSTNTGTNVLAASFVLGADVPQVNGVEFTADVATASATLPAWWQFKNTGSCRAASLTANSVVSASAVNCADWSEGAAIGGIATYTVGLSGPNTARITGVFAVAPSGAPNLVAGQEYFAFNVNINNQKTVGIGACAGCTTPACVAINTIKIDSPQPAVVLTGPTNGFDSQFVSWQGGGSVGGSCALGSVPGVPVVTSTVGRGVVDRSVNTVNYPVGTPLTLSAVPKPGALFSAWSGDTTTTQATLDIVVPHTLNYVATFVSDPAAAPSVQAVSDVPGDQGAVVNVTWTRSPLDAAAYPAGTMCCYKVQSRPAGSGAAWTDLANVTADHNLNYEQDVPTLADATPLDPALFEYRVVASSLDGGQWISSVVNGASVDNIAPPDPTSVSGAIASGIATLFWPAVSAPDFLTYRIYRSPDGVPPLDVAHRIASTTATGYNDSPGYFANYVVTTVDVHLNESHGTSFAPVNAAGVDGRPAPGALTVGNPTPSPMARQMRLSLGLPYEMNVSVDVLDPQGRLVRRLQDGVSPAGWFTLAWDARDAQGNAAAPGLYFVRVRTAGGERMKRLVVLP